MLPPTFVEGFHDRQDVERMPYRQLGGTDLVVSAIGFGGSSVGGCFGLVGEASAIEAVHIALKLGVNYIDTAPWYEDSECVLGEALATVPRQAYYIGSKVGRYDGPIKARFDFSAARVQQSVQKTLERLRLSYVDVLQVHDLEFAPSLEIIIQETLPALQRVKEAGLARYIGITAYPLGPLEEIVQRSPVPLDTVLTYCRRTLEDDSLRRSSLLPMLQERGIGVINAGATAMGLLTPKGAPEWHPAPQVVKDACAAARQLCAEEGVDIARLAVRHSTLSDARVHTTLVGTANPEEVKQNVAAIVDQPTALEEATSRKVIALLKSRLGGKASWEGAEVEAYWKQTRV